MAQVPNTPTHTGARRRSQRVLMQVPVRIRGKDAQGLDFEEFTETLAINAHGALVLLGARLTSGAAVHMRHNKTEEEQECRVAFPPEDWTPKSPEARAISINRTVK